MNQSSLLPHFQAKNNYNNNQKKKRAYQNPIFSQFLNNRSEKKKIDFKEKRQYAVTKSRSTENNRFFKPQRKDTCYFGKERKKSGHEKERDREIS